jgi:hypothetical protein
MRTIRKGLAAAAIGSVFLISWSGPAYGQRQYPYTPPSRPTISPYFSLLRRDTAGLPSYQFFLQRDARLRDSLQRQEVSINVLERELSPAPSERREMIRTPTTQFRARSATFLDYSRFYPRSVTVGQAQR